MKRKLPAWMRTRKKPTRSALVLAALCALASGVGCLGERRVELPRGQASVLVTSEPDGATIIFDGNPHGAAYAKKPVEIKGVAYGRHSIRAQFPGYVTQVLEVDVRSEKVPLKMRLSKGGEGRLVIRSSPSGAEVFINSRYYGKADPALEVTTLAAGEHSMWLRLPGHLMERQNVIVESRRERHYQVALDKAP